MLPFVYMKQYVYFRMIISIQTKNAPYGKSPRNNFYKL